MPRTEAQEREDERLFLAHAEAAGLSPELAWTWALGANESFGGGSPLEVLRYEGARLLEVIEAVEDFAAGRAPTIPLCTCASHGTAAEYRHGLGCRYGAELRRRAHASLAPVSDDERSEPA